MIFNFILRNHHDTSLNSLADLLQPIWHGLAENGHQVIRFGTRFYKPPAVNVLVEFFDEDPYVEALLQLKHEQGEGVVLGLICTEDPTDRIVMDAVANRRANLDRLLPVMDFVWPLLPVPGYYEQAGVADRTRLLRYGFSEGYLDRDLIAEPAGRDFDTLLYGNEHGRRVAVAAAIRQQDVGCVVTSREYYPGFMADDLVRRAKLVLDLRRGPDVRFLSPTRIVKALHSGTLVVSERFDSSEIASLYDYTVTCAYEEMAGRCVELVRSGEAVRLGLETMARFRAETSMARNLREAMHLPLFERLAQQAADA